MNQQYDCGTSSLNKVHLFGRPGGLTPCVGIPKLLAFLMLTALTALATSSPCSGEDVRSKQHASGSSGHATSTSNDSPRTGSPTKGGYTDFVDTTENPHAVYDPLEGFNRGIFWFNDKLDIYLLEPVASTYDMVIPDRAQKGVSNFFANLRYPVNLVSNLVQLDFSKAGTDTARFIVNTTAGVGGLMDIAEEMGLKKNYQDFGTALGHWGVEPGPYLVLPLLGPSSLRDGLAKIVDSTVHPAFYLNYVAMPNHERNIINFSSRGLDLVQSRADLLEAIKTGKEASFDYYSFLRSSYTQRRKAMIHGATEFEDEEPPPGASISPETDGPK